ncbi:unnamed protein product, partial [Ectocarpus fasciculatus]
ARGLEQEDQVERADRRKENDRALLVARKERPSSETSKAREPGNATAGYGADDRPFERGEGQPQPMDGTRRHVRHQLSPSVRVVRRIAQTAGGGLVALTRGVAGDQALPEAVTTAGRGPEAVAPGAGSCPTNDRALEEGRGTTPVVAIPTATGEIQGAADDLGTRGHLHGRIPA